MLPFNFSNPKVPSSYSQNPLYGHPFATTHHHEQLLCPWGKKALAFFLNSTHLIRTLSLFPSVSVLTWFNFNSLRPTVEFNLDMLNRLKTIRFKHFPCFTIFLL